MMEGTRCEEIETTNKIESRIKTESSIEINSTFYEKDGSLVELDSELPEDFCAVMQRIKYEKTEVAEDIEPAPLSETCEIPRSEQNLKFSRIISESTAYTPLMSFCRLCATQSNSMVYMFSQNELQNNIIEKIEYCFSIEVKKTDTLPNEVCDSCLEKLELCYQFHKTVEAAEKQFRTFKDGQCNKEKYKSFFDQDAHGNIIKRQPTLQELPKRDTEPQKNCTIISNSIIRKATYCINRPNKESRTESSSDKDQSTCNSLLRSPLHDMDEKLRVEISQRMKEEAKNNEINDDIGVEVLNKRTSAGKNISHESIKCQKCRKTFGTVNQCLAHSSIHTSTGYYPCCLCGAIFQTRKDCNEHSLKHKEGEYMKREEVQTNSGNESVNKSLREANLKAEIKPRSKISSGNKLHCKKCNEDIDSETSLYERLQHMLTVHQQQKESSQNICERELSDSEQLMALESKRDFNLECKWRNRRFRSNDILERHKKTNCNRTLVSMKTGFTCVYCRSRFREKRNLRIHIKRHTGERPYSCDLCNKMFEVEDERDSHCRKHIRERPFKCSKCKKRCNSAAALRSHFQVHSNIRPYSCHVCDLSFKRLSSRDVHMRIHSGERPYECNLCDKMFRLKDVRDAHLRRHTGEKPFKCSKCDKRFTTSSILTRHSLGHLDSKPYSCDLCDLSFRTINARDVHLRTHTGERPFRCDKCGVNYTQNWLLRRHKKNPCPKTLLDKSQN